MRKYQKKMAGEMSRLYKSKDPLRYLFLASRLGVNNYRPSEREARILTRRIGKLVNKAVESIKTVVPAVVKGVENLAKAAVQAAENMKKLSEAASDRDRS